MTLTEFAQRISLDRSQTFPLVNATPKVTTGFFVALLLIERIGTEQGPESILRFIESVRARIGREEPEFSRTIGDILSLVSLADIYRGSLNDEETSR